MRAPALALAALVCVAGTARASERAVHLCFVPDTQHLTSSVNWLQERDSCRADNKTSRAYLATKFTCSGSACEKSPYCKGSWFETGRQLLRNMAFDMTGQWEKEDYTGIGELDGATAPWKGPRDHPRCDAILSLGDMMDITSFPTKEPEWVRKLGGTAYVSRDPRYDDLPDWQKAQADVIDKDFWSIIRASGVPYLPVPGNHDPPKLFRRLLASLEFTSAPFFHAQEPGREQENAILFKTPTGKRFCALNLTEGIVFKATQKEIDWVIENVGCGGGHPTILIQHGGVFGARLMSDTPKVVTAAAARTKAIVIVAGGHWGLAVSSKVERQNALNGRTQFLLYSNWQAVALHQGGNLSRPHGATEFYGAGIYYTIVRIDPVEKTLHAWDWSPYWRSRKMGEVDTDGVGTSSLETRYDLDAAFP